jgi:Fibronectin type III-like domain
MELKHFTKIKLVTQQKETITLTLTKDAFAYYDIVYNKWIVECGELETSIGACGTDIRLSAIIYINFR